MRGANRDFTVFCWFIAIALGFFITAASAQASRTSPELDAIATWLAQREVTVLCLNKRESTEDWVIASGASGYVEGTLDRFGAWHPKDWTVLEYRVCEVLYDLLRGDASRHSAEDVVWAVLVLTHESGHLRGHRWSAYEEKTQCWAMRHLWYVAQRLGLEDRSLVIAYAREIHADMPAEYQQMDCELPKP